jgi:quercetin dioxygenase-like cupin family protein
MFIESKTTKTEATGPGVTRQILGHDAQLMMVRVTIAKGSVGAPHTHPHRQVSFIESGRFQLTLGAEKRELKAGDSFFVEPNLPHGVVALEDGVILDVFSPAREEFLG